MIKFRPTRTVEDKKGHLTLRVDSNEKALIQHHAKAQGVTVTRFIRLAVFYAIDNIDSSHNREI